jgi:KaiC/GvpD/RAD55 family RecA-like ATPase
MNSKKDTDQLKPKISLFQIGRKEQIEQELPVVTGYIILDTLLCGGLPQKFAVALTSMPCDEKDLLIRRFLETGAENDETVFYVAIEPSLAGSLPQHYSSTFHMFICNPRGGAILERAPNISLLKGVENLTELSVSLTSAVRKLKPSQTRMNRICLNIISDVLLLHGAVQTRRWLTELLTELKSFGFTTFAVIDPQIHPPEQLYAIIDLFEGEINIREAETDQGLGRFLRIKRMSNQKYLKDEVYLEEQEQQKHKTSGFEDPHSKGFMRLS